MYYMDRQSLQVKLSFLKDLVGCARELSNIASPRMLSTQQETYTVVLELARERWLHVAMEAVTDIGHMLIDCFMMRDAGSYEDIIVILHEEQVIDDLLRERLLSLVQLKAILVKQFEVRLQSASQRIAETADVLPLFVNAVHEFTAREFGKIGE